MHLKLLALAGFTITTICTSICPMEMGMAPMDMTGHDMAMASHDMSPEQPEKAPCENCEHHDTELVALSTPTSIAHVVSQIPFAVFTTHATYTASVPETPSSLLANGPPFPADTLVGTVVLRT